jgi:hypothetical protein
MRARSRGVLALLGALAAVALTVPDAGAAALHTYGPPHGRFMARFPSTPTDTSTGSQLLGSFPAGSLVNAYWVSPTPNLYGSTAVTAKAPTYVVVVAEIKKASDVVRIMNTASLLTQAKVVHIDGHAGYETVLSQGLVHGHVKGLKIATSTAGVLALSVGKTVYLLQTVTTTAKATRTFFSSFVPKS